MRIDRAGLQPGLSLTQFNARFGREADCEAALATARWPDGFRCPRCGGQAHSRFSRGERGYWQCSDCRHQVSALSGTIFQASKLPLTGWFLAMYLLAQSRNTLPALELMRHLGVSYRTAWTVKHKLLQAMDAAESTRSQAEGAQLAYVVVGGTRAQSAARGGIHMRVSVQRDSLGKPDTILLQRDTGTSPRAEAAATAGVRGLTSSIRANLSRGYRAIHYRKYGQRYLAEAQFRFNHRRSGAELAPLLTAAAHTKPCPEKLLRL